LPDGVHPDSGCLVTGHACPLPRSILVVDDDPVFLRTMEAVLVRYGHRVAARSDPVAALADAEEAAPALLVTDFEMPGLDGFELFRRLRARDPFLRGVLVSAHVSPERLVAIMESGIHDAVPKPLGDHHRLVEAVERQLHEARRWRVLLRNLKGVG
jgi:two-component system C4-dicarboxylate transport response regulator DctD